MSRDPNVAATEEFTRGSSLGYQVNHLARLLEAALHQRISPLGVVPGQFAQLLALYEEDGLSQRELCDLVRIEQPTMAKTLQRMERGSLISREPDPGDRRLARVLLTAHARALRGDLIDAATEVNAAATKGLSDRQVSEFMRTLSRIIDNLQTASEQPHRKRGRPVTPMPSGAAATTSRACSQTPLPPNT
jgi:DNA-binding MarR family transcriptional regulator